ncbi:hypothetical protein Q080_04398 [Pseudomonas aeruginosa M8A.1]|nr:hypothetical protein Q080_04398 [Pseudomonas aeruginosa M8A.1]
MDKTIDPVILMALLICFSRMSRDEQIDLLRLACAYMDKSI